MSFPARSEPTEASAAAVAESPRRESLTGAPAKSLAESSGAPRHRLSTHYNDGSAGVAQLVEHHLAKVRVAGSSPVARSDETPGQESFSGS